MEIPKKKNVCAPNGFENWPNGAQKKWLLIDGFQGNAKKIQPC